MLVMSRKKNESVVINNDITITVVEIRGDKVRLGIAAPRDVPVHRMGVFDVLRGVHDVEVPVVVRPLPAEAGDPVPELIVECRLAPGSPAQVQFTPEGGFFFPGSSPSCPLRARWSSD
jgi:carbon storage regulator